MIKQRHVAALLAEFFGTLTLVLVVLSVSLYRFPFFTAIAAGVTVAVFVSAFSKIGAGHLNPAVTLGMFVIRKTTAIRAVGYIAVQMLAGLAGWQLYEYLTGRSLTNITTSGIEWQPVVAELLGAFVFGLAIAAVVTQKIQGYQAAYTIGAGLFLGLTVAGLASNSLLNPAVAFGVRSFEPVAYFAAPVVGVAIGMLVVAYGMITVEKVKDLTKQAVVKTAASTPANTKVEAPDKKPAAKKAPAKKPAAKKTTKK